MDESEIMDPAVISGLFEQGVRPFRLGPPACRAARVLTSAPLCPQLMGIETEAEYNGAECSFTSAIIAIEGEDKLTSVVACIRLRLTQWLLSQSSPRSTQVSRSCATFTTRSSVHQHCDEQMIVVGVGI